MTPRRTPRDPESTAPRSIPRGQAPAAGAEPAFFTKLSGHHPVATTDLPKIGKAIAGLVQELTKDILTGAGAAPGRRDEALRFSQKLAAIRQPDLRGGVSAARGCIAASLGDKAGAVELVRQAAREGWLPLFQVHRERCHDGVRGYPAFEEFIRPKG